MDWIRSFGPKTKRFNLYDTTGIKQELDKTIISVVSSDKDFYKDNFYINLKIILGFTSLGVAGLVYSFSCPTQQCQVKTFVSVITFFLLSLLGPWFIQSWENKAIVFGTLHNYKLLSKLSKVLNKNNSSGLFLTTTISTPTGFSLNKIFRQRF
ncbi:hypothetical protein Gasu2_31880 [Galdieria sulphuraria]|nr:hypothetical protein Gasu2_31880 [Galdieria sulphuraria]